MRIIRTSKSLMCTALLAFSLTSCIKEEALNAEADIVSCKLDKDILIRQPVITNDEVRFYVNAENDITQLAPVFTLSEGATVEPASGTTKDFTTPQTYTVTSQDGQWKKTYKVSFVFGNPATDYHFDNVRFYEKGSQKRYHIFYDQGMGGTELTWSSGNFGFMIIAGNASAEDYPTSQAEDGYVGKCAKLVTRSTGPLGLSMKTPLAAGNLFVGDFRIDIGNPAKSTRFGIPFYKVPLRLSGYYKYKAGAKYTNQNLEEQADKKDIFDIYAVMYEVTSGVPYLDGTNIKTHENIVMMAQVEERKETDEWTHFSAVFKPVNGKSIDAVKLREGKYNLAIVMSSSEGGADFKGAIGSTLYVDEMNLYYE